MGMTASFVAVSPAELESLINDATDLSDLLFERLGESEPSQAVDIDKSWAAIHFMLTGSQWGGNPPESLPILGGVEIGPDIGYGPARYLDPSSVQKAYAVLYALPTDELKKRFIPEKLEAADIYPSGIWIEEGEEGSEYIAHWYEQLRFFYRAASERGDAVILAVV